MRSLLCALLLSSAAAGLSQAAEEGLSKPSEGNLKDQVWVVETSEEDASDSLNRIAGDIDAGFAAPGQTYRSNNHSGAGPFARQKAIDEASGH